MMEILEKMIFERAEVHMKVLPDRPAVSATNLDTPTISGDQIDLLKDQITHTAAYEQVLKARITDLEEEMGIYE